MIKKKKLPHFTRFVSLLTAVVLVALLLAACSNSNSQNQSQSPSAPVSGSSESPSSANPSNSSAPSNNAPAVDPAVYDDITVSYGLSAPWEKLQPFNITVSGWYGGLIVDKIFDSVVFASADGTFSERNATEWSISEDGKTITFKLNPDAKWHDGEPVTSADWLFTLKTVTNAAVTIADQGGFNVFEGTEASGVETSPGSLGVEAPDPYTLVLHFKQITTLDEFLLSAPRKLRVIPEHLLKDIPPAELLTNPFWNAPIGSGPFRFVSEIPGNTVELAVNKDYYLGAPKFGHLVFKQIAPANLATSLLAGEIDYLYTNLSTEDAKLLQGNDGIEVLRANNPTGWVAIIINNQVITDYRIREAFNFAIDKQSIIDKLYDGEGEPSGNYLIPTSKYYDKTISTARNVEKAKELLAEANWDTNRVLTIAVPAGIRERIATIVQQNFEEVGIKLDLFVTDPPTMYAGMTDGTFDFGFAGYSMTLDPMDQYGLYMDDRISFSHVSDPKFHEIYDRYKNEPNEAKRFDILLEWQKYIDEQQPFVNILHAYKYSCYSSRLSNFVPEDSDLFNENVWQWSVQP